jgi:hypothetical protein
MRLSWLDFFSHLGQVGWGFHSTLQWLARPNFYSICVGLPLGFFVAVFPLGVAWLVFEVIHPNNSTATVSAFYCSRLHFLPSSGVSSLDSQHYLERLKPFFPN